MAKEKDLYEFLVEAELQHYFNSFKNDLKVNTVSQLKYVEDEDLVDMGMTRPEQRRLKKFFRRECPQGALGKIKKILTKTGLEGHSSPPLEKSPQHVKSANKHIIPFQDITVCKTLGTGEFGTVLQGVWTNEEGERVQVAIKCLSKEKMQTGTPDFLKEASIMHTIEHDHIVQLYGVVLDSESLMLVSELAPLRSLLECLKEPALRSSFPVTVLCDFAVQISSGMSYLEGKRLIHRDLAARNILVFAKDRVKISDFGLSRALGVGKDYYQTNFNVNLKLPIAWCAPECINYLKFTSSSDVWAFGVTLWEMFSYGFQPWAAFSGQQNLESLEVENRKLEQWEIDQKILEAIDEPNFQRLEKPDCCTKDHYEIMLKCWEHEPEKRPKFSELTPMIAQIRPDLVQATKDFPDVVPRSDYLNYRTSDIITVLDKKPEGAPSQGMWKGILPNGKAGFFNPGDTAPYVEIKTASPLHAGRRMQRKGAELESTRKSLKGARAKLRVDSKLRTDMISRPQNDLRHTGHIGYDGATFGDISFIGDNYDKLPVKVVSPYKPQDDLVGSNLSLPRTGTDSDDGTIQGCKSEASLLSEQPSLWSDFSTKSETVSQCSASDTLTDVSSMLGISDAESISRYKMEDRPLAKYEDFGDDAFDDFKMPDLSTSLDLDFGPSFMDEVMKALSDSQDDKPQSETPLPILNDNPSFEPDEGEETIKFTEKGPELKSPDFHTATEAWPISNPYVEDPVHAPPSPIDKETTPTPEDMEEEEEEEEKKHKSKLKLFVPSRESAKEPKKQVKVKPMSASDEKKIDTAIALANEFAQLSAQEQMGHSPRTADSTDSALDRSTEDEGGTQSPKSKSVFSFKKKSSPKVEKRNFTDEIASVPDLNEDLTPEAQEAYNLLVAKGKERGDKDKLQSSGSSKHSRERRMRRAMEHQQHSDGAVGDSAAVMRNGRSINMNIREPQGIPGRRNSATKNGIEEPEEVDVNPLRRLRAGQAIIKPRIPRRPSSDQTDGPEPLSYAARKANPQIPLASRLKDTEPAELNGKGDSSPAQIGVAEPLVRHSSDSDTSPRDSVNALPLPPRKIPSRPGMLNAKPRERKYPLVVGKDPRNLPPPPPPPPQDENSKDSINKESKDGIYGVDSSRVQQDVPKQYSVDKVKVKAEELGLNNNTDMFWSQKVDFAVLEHAASDSDITDEMAPIPGSYKTSESISYEDLLEFALDGSRGSKSGDQSICDEVRLMRKVLSKEVEIKDCIRALEETRWDVHNAIKYIKLKQLLSTGLGEAEHCKQALMRCGWNVEQATNYVLTNPPDKHSPECVDV